MQKQSIKLFLTSIILLVFECWSYLNLGNPPVPKCKPGFFYRTLPLTPNQASIINLDHLFDGYNLEYTLEGAEDFQKYISLGKKLTQQGREIPDVPLVGLKNYHIEKKGNTWGSSFIALTERSERTFVHFGVINSNKSAPVVNNYISVENNTNTTCFDAVIFPAKDIILVDCIVQLKTPNTRGQMIENTFYYHKISDGSFIRKVKTEMYVDFKKISRRSVHLYSDLQSKHSFLLRTYYHDGLSKEHSGNTYVEVFMITDPEDPWIVEIIDRAFLRASSLQIADMRIYQGQIYILDIIMGVYRVYINTQQDLKFKAYYEVKGFERLGVYSNDLDNNLELALANSHSVYEIDWSESLEPRLINKYSLMPDSVVSQVFLNERFLFVQSSSKDVLTYNYTWMMNRGDRTYSKAFKVISHDTEKTIIDVNEDESYLIVIDDEKLVNYALDDSNMIIRLGKDQDLMDVINSFNVTGISSDPMDNSTTKKCQIRLNFTLVEENNRTMWPIGDAPPDQYTANFPGKIVIKLQQYVLGPNVTYRIKEIDHDVIKKHKVYIQDQLKVVWQEGEIPPFENITITFLQTQTFNDMSKPNDVMMIYLQDDQNKSYFVYCLPSHLNEEVICNETAELDLGGKIHSWAAGGFVNQYTLQYNHVVAYSTTRHYNRIKLIENTKKQALQQEIQLEKGFAGNATSVAITGRDLYVVLKYVKTVHIYELDLCIQGICQPKCSLTHMKMYQLGVKFFSPTEVHTSVFHPNVMFIRTAVQIIVVDYNRDCVPKVLAIVEPVDTAEIDFLFKVNSDHMIVTVLSTGQILEYDIRRLELGEITMTKSFPKYGYQIPKLYDMDVSDMGSCIYATMVNEGGDYQIFVYRSGYPAVGTLYNVIDLFSYEAILVDATGYKVDYVTVFSGSQLRIFREYQDPLAEIFNPNISYSFYLEYLNPTSKSNLEQIDVRIINLPTYIKVNPILDDIMNTKDLLHSGNNVVNQIDDSDWWKGNVLRIQPDCRDCRGNDSIIKINNHIQEEYIEDIVPLMAEFQWSFRGGSIQTINSLINMKHNGSIEQFVKLPYQEPQFCSKLTVGYKSKEYEVSGCVTQHAINLYLTSYVSQKAFAFEPHETPADNLFKLDSVNDLIILVDTEQNAYEKNRPGGIYFYALNFDDEIPSGLVEIEYFNGDDIGMEELGDIYVNNAELTYHQETDTYRLYMTEMTKGFFVVDFKYTEGSTHISVRTISYLPVVDMLTPLKFQMPYDATYQAIGMISSEYDPTLKKTTQTILLTTGKFHTIEIKLDFDMTGHLMLNYISRLYMRYAFYDIQNYIKHQNGLFVINQILPVDFQVQNRSKQLLTIYSTRGKHDNTSIEERGFLGAFRIDNRGLHYYDFNLTYTGQDGHSQPRMGMVVIEEFASKLQKFSVHHNLSVTTKHKVDTQIIYIDLKNDFSLEKIRILMNGNAPFPQWKLILIILFSIIGFVMLVILALFLFKKFKERQVGGYGQEGDTVNDYQNSLISGSNERKSIVQPLRDSVPEEKVAPSRRQRRSERVRQESPENEAPKRRGSNSRYRAPSQQEDQSSEYSNDYRSRTRNQPERSTYSRRNNDYGGITDDTPAYGSRSYQRRGRDATEESRNYDSGSRYRANDYGNNDDYNSSYRGYSRNQTSERESERGRGRGESRTTQSNQSRPRGTGRVTIIQD